MTEPGRELDSLSAPTVAGEPGPDRRTLALFRMTAACLVGVNVLYFQLPHPVLLPARLQIDFPAPPVDGIAAPWKSDSDLKIFDDNFIDKLDRRLESRRTLRQSRLELNSSEALLGMGRTDEGLAALGRAIDLDPKNFEARKTLIRALSGLERWSDARAQLDLLRAEGGDYPDPDRRLLEANPQKEN